MRESLMDVVRWFSREAGLRFLMRRKAACAVAVATMTLALGANTAVFSVLKAFLLSSLALPEPERLVAVEPLQAMPGRGDVVFSEAYPNYVLLRETQRVFSDVTCTLSGTASFDDRGTARPVQVSRVTASFFATMRVQPALGSAFSAKDEGPSPAPVAIVSHSFWKNVLNADAAIVGSTIRIDGTPYSVQGVMPEGFAQPAPTELWLPFDLPERARTSITGARQLAVFGRLAPGKSFAAGVQAMAEFTTRTREASSVDNKAFRYQIRSLRQSLLGNAESTVLLVQVGAGVLLLLAVLNLAALLIAWGFDRRQEMAIRQALGARNTRIVRMLMMQSVVVVGASAAIGALVTSIVLPWVRNLELGPNLAFFMANVAIDRQVMLVSVLIALAASLIAGVLPAWFSRNTNLTDGLRSGSRSATLSPAALRWQQGMVFGQAALSVVIIATAALIGVSFQNLNRIAVGIHAPGALVARVQLQDNTYGTHELRAAFADKLFDNLSREPALASAAFTSTLPVSDVISGNRFFVEQPDGSLGSDPLLLHIRRTSWNYLSAIGIPLVNGRAFDSHDVAANAAVAIISKPLADRLWPSQSPIGKHIYRNNTGGRPPTPLEVVGVAGAVRDAGLNAPPGETVYVPFAQISSPRLSIVVQSRVKAGAGSPAQDAATYAAIRHALQLTDPVLAATGQASLATLEQQANSLPRMQSTLLVTFALVAVGIAVMGCYGVMSQLVSNREREFALRLVFGALPIQLGRSVLLQNARLTLPGVALGIAAVLLLGGSLKRFVFGVEPNSASLLATVGAGMAVIALIATLPSAYRAMRVSVRQGVV